MNSNAEKPLIGMALFAFIDTRLVLRIVGIKMLLMIFPFTLQVRLWKELNIQFFHNDSVLPLASAGRGSI